MGKATKIKQIVAVPIYPGVIFKKGLYIVNYFTSLTKYQKPFLINSTHEGKSQMIGMFS